MTKPHIVYAEPQKTFFIDWLTRDIDLMDCILDLIDNSIHNLIREFDTDVMRQLTNTTHKRFLEKNIIAISVSSSEFIITDNCGGIDRDAAIEDVFLFGHKRPPEMKPGLGLYGVGMKRAIFKLGRNIEIISRTDKDSFRIPIDIEKWRKSTGWTFDLYDIPRRRDKTSTMPGVKIKITNLFEQISKRLGGPSLAGELEKKIESVYALFLSSGLRITVNSKEVISALPEFEVKAAKPAWREFKFGNVSATIVVGLTPKNHRRPEGWYIFCNGRLVLEKDQSPITGWGVDQYPQFHSKYNHFLGLVYFMSNRLEELPWTTTKEIATDSQVYNEALTEMKILARPVLNELNKLYPTEDDDEAVVQREVFKDSESASVARLSKKSQSTFSLTKAKKSLPEDVLIKYSKPKSIVEKVKRALAVLGGSSSMSVKEVGERTFDYFFDKEC